MHAWQRCKRAICNLPRGLFAVLVLAWGLMLGGCESSSEDTATGELVIGITDAKGDFHNYTVAISALTLTKANGAVVEVLPLTTELDFSQYTEMTEILTAATVPTGVYVQATMTLDYTEALIVVEDSTGHGIRVPHANIVDGEGETIEQLEVTVHLEDRDRLVIEPGLPAHMTLDFDLQASNRVVFDDEDVPSVTVEPFLVADIELERPKIQRVRGPLAGVSLDRGTYEVIIRPFHHRVRDTDRRRRFGTLTVVTTDETLFDINHQTFSGAAGLEALAAQPTFTATVAIGELKFDPRRFEAREVYAGSSVPGGDLDVVQGTVLARSLVEDVITVKGATLIRAGGSIVFNDSVRVMLHDSTVVKKQFSSGLHDIDDISIGQRVRIFGTLTDEMDLQLDASNGYARLLLSVLTGTRTDDPAQADQELVVDLQTMNHRRVSLYEFAGTGATPEEDAEADNYEVDTATLDLSDIETGSPLQVRGFANRFGTAPADYLAQTVIDLTALRAVMSVNWDPASPAAFARLGEDAMVLDLTGTGAWHHVHRGGVTIDLTELSDAPVIRPGDSDAGAFVVQQGDAMRLHTRFAGFVDDIQARLDAGGAVQSVRASGAFDDGDATLTARTVWVRMR